MGPGFRLDGRYRLERRLGGGAGGRARVWEARDELLARRVVLKTIPLERAGAGPEPRREFRDGAQAAAGLAHPGIVTTYDYGEADGPDGSGLTLPYVVTEFLDGPTLAARLEKTGTRAGALAPGEAVAVCARIAEALAAAHAAGVVHGALEPASVFLTPDGAKVVDVGLAGLTRDAAERTGTGAWQDPAAPAETRPAPSPFMAPELLAGQDAGPEADVHAMGVILARCLGPAAVVPEEVAEICARCRSERPGERPAARELAETLAASVPPGDALPTAEPGHGPAGTAGPAEGGGRPARAGLRELRERARGRLAVALGAMAAAGVGLAIVPLLMVVMSFASPGSGGGAAIPPPVPQRPSGPPGMDAVERGAAPGRTGPPAPEGAGSPSPEPRPAKTVVSTLSRMRRSIDLGIAAGQIAPPGRGRAGHPGDHAAQPGRRGRAGRPGPAGGRIARPDRPMRPPRDRPGPGARAARAAGRAGRTAMSPYSFRIPLDGRTGGDEHHKLV
ncbi:protein kinase domain-containing protein [Spirillospora sp. CA-255316]